jgi:cell division protein FtsQ
MKRERAWRRRTAPGDRNLWLAPNGRRRGAEDRQPAASPRRRLKRRARLLLVALFLAIAAPLGVWAVRGGHLPFETASLDEALALHTVSVEGNHRAPASELVAATGLTAGMPLLDIDVETVEALVEAHPWIARAHVVRVPPSLVLVSVVEREPLAVAAEEGGAPWLVDAAGLPFAPAGADDVAALPWLAAPYPVRQGVASTELARGAALALALRGTALRDGAEIHVAPPPDAEGLSLLVEGVRGRVVLGHGDLADKLRRLEELRLAGLPETSAAAVIDLRFVDRAVLRSAAPPPEAAQHIMGTVSGGTSPPPGRRS